MAAVKKLKAKAILQSKLTKTHLESFVEVRSKATNILWISEKPPSEEIMEQHISKMADRIAETYGINEIGIWWYKSYENFVAAGARLGKDHKTSLTTPR